MTPQHDIVPALGAFATAPLVAGVSPAGQELEALLVALVTLVVREALWWFRNRRKP